MALFRRGKDIPDDSERFSDVSGVADGDLAAGGEDTVFGPGSDDAGTASLKTPEDVGDASDYIKLGALWVKGLPGMQLQLEIEPDTQQIVGVHVPIDDSDVGINVYAAPRTFGVWTEIRAEIAAKVEQAGGTSEIRPGRFGGELFAELPLPEAYGADAKAPTRFIGIDGPRYFVRVCVTGRGAVEPEAVPAIDETIANLVVVRGEEPMAPREVLHLTIPADAQQVDPTADAAQDQPKGSGLNPFERGPEITEIH